MTENNEIRELFQTMEEAGATMMKIIFEKENGEKNRAIILLRGTDMIDRVVDAVDKTKED